MREIPFIEIVLHWPHDRFALGWEYMQADEKYEYRTLKLYLSIMTMTINF